MLTAYLHQVCTDDADQESLGETRDRLKELFPRGATRRMTQLGMLIGHVLRPCVPGENDTLVYVSEYSETQALEGYLDSFPSASPTLFQTSIHPSAVQQTLIQQQQPVRTFFPITGSRLLVAQALQTALLGDTPRAILCGGEERGTWLLENRLASARSFAFALVLTPKPAGALGKISISDDWEFAAELTVHDFFQALHRREKQTLHGKREPWFELQWS